MWDSELGEVPVGWEIKAIQDLAKTIKGKSYKSAELSESKTALVTLKSFNRGGGYRLDGLKEYTGSYKGEQEVFAGDLIIAYTDVTQAADVIGKPAMVVSDSRYEHLVISLDVAVVRPEIDGHKYFLYGLARTDTFQNHTKSYTTGTTVLHLGKSAVPEFQFPAPSEELMKLYMQNVSSMFILVNEKIEESKNIERLRDTLLPKLLSGEVSVSEAEKVMGELA
nr:restriction endonuclease subunit S [Methanococcoides seepicolus]